MDAPQNKARTASWNSFRQYAAQDDYEGVDALDFDDFATMVSIDLRTSYLQ